MAAVPDLEHLTPAKQNGQPSSASPPVSPPVNHVTLPPPVPSAHLADSSEPSRQTTVGGGAPVGARGRSMSLSQHPLFAARVRGLRLRIMRFTPSWFSVTMGTGIVNSLLFNIPFSRVHTGFRAFGACFLLLDIFLFLKFFIISAIRYTCYRPIWTVMLRDETHSLFLGCMPMALVTIVTGIARTGGEYGLTWTLDLSLVLWWIALVSSVGTSFGVPYMMFTQHQHTSEALTAGWMLPVVPPITIAASGSSLVNLLIEHERFSYALTILVTSYIMCGVGFLLACGLLVLYFQRLALHHLPAREVIVSTFLPLGPCGQGGYALVELGKGAMRLFPFLAAAYPGRPGFDELPVLGPAMWGAGVVTGLLFWGLGIWWMFLAVMSVGTHYLRKEISFNMGWWAFTFPLGSLTLLTYSLASTFDSLFFKVVACMMTFAVTALWAVCFVPTAMGFFRGTLFPAPCLASLPPDFVSGTFPTRESDKL